jgi:prevent-host-death family protein
MERVISTDDLRVKTHDVIKQATSRGEHIIVETSGKPAIAIISIEEYRELMKAKQQMAERERRFDLMRQAGARNDMTEEEAYALAEEAREWAHQQIHKTASQ